VQCIGEACAVAVQQRHGKMPAQVALAVTCDSISAAQVTRRCAARAVKVGKRVSEGKLGAVKGGFAVAGVSPLSMTPMAMHFDVLTAT
jgi:hypothetical protein